MSRSGVAIHNCVACVDDELSFVPGDTITNIEPVEGNSVWAWGTTQGRRGRFPLTSVRILDTTNSTQASNQRASTTQSVASTATPAVSQPSQSAVPRTGVATDDCVADDADELGFKKGDRITNILPHPGTSEWLTGECNGKRGMFPAEGFVKLDPLPSTAASEPARSSMVANPAFQPEPIASTTTTEAPAPATLASPAPVAQAQRPIVPRTGTAMQNCRPDGPDELGFQKGDRIINIVPVNDTTEWLQGACNGRTGFFPASFVELDELPKPARPGVLTAVAVVPPQTSTSTQQQPQQGRFQTTAFVGAPAPMTGALVKPAPPPKASLPVATPPPPELPPMRTGKATQDCRADVSDELGFKKGDKITEIIPVDGDTKWLKGSAKGKTGIFPAAFVKLDDSPKVAAPKPPAPVKERKGVALYSCTCDVPGSEELEFKEGDVLTGIIPVPGNIDWLRGTCNGQTGLIPAGYVLFDGDKPPTATTTSTTAQTAVARNAFDPELIKTSKCFFRKRTYAIILTLSLSVWITGIILARVPITQTKDDGPVFVCPSVCGAGPQRAAPLYDGPISNPPCTDAVRQCRSCCYNGCNGCDTMNCKYTHCVQDGDKRKTTTTTWT